MKSVIKIIDVSPDNSDLLIRQMGRMLFPLKNRLVIIVDNCFQVESILPLLSELNRSIVLVCNFCIEKEIINIPENVKVIDFSLIDRECYCQNVKIYNCLLNPIGVIVTNGLYYKERIWCEQANYYNIETLTIDLTEKYEIVISMINSEFSYRLSEGCMAEKLFVGCDKYLIEGWLNTDLREGGKIKYLDISKRLPFGEKEFQYIFIEDTLEYLDLDKCVNALSEIYRILKYGGCLRISMLNIDFITTVCSRSQELINKKYIDWFIHNNTIDNISNLKVEEMPIIIFDKLINKSGYLFFYDIDVVILLLKKSGFKKISRYTTGESNESAFENIEQQIFTYPMWINQIQFASLEAVKL